MIPVLAATTNVLLPIATGSLSLFLRPISDQQKVGWTSVPSSPTTIWDKIDEVVADDTDYGQSAEPSLRFYQPFLANAGRFPTAQEDVVMVIRGRANGVGTTEWRLGEGLGEGFNIFKEADLDGPSFTTVEYTFSEAEVASFSTWDGLLMYIEKAGAPAGNSPSTAISQVYLEFRPI